MVVRSKPNLSFDILNLAIKFEMTDVFCGYLKTGDYDLFLN